VGPKKRAALLPALSRRVAKIVGLVSAVVITATGCSAQEVLRFGWPEGVTPQADRMRMFWTGTVIAALVVGVIVWALILWPVAFHRKRSEQLPKQFQYHHVLEIFYTGLPLLIVLVLFYFTATTENYVLDDSAEPDVTVDVVAFQWNWEFRYPGHQTPDGQTVRTLGTSTEIPLLVVPVGKTVRYHVESVDVIHSFFVPEMNFKRDVFPQPDKNNQDPDFQNTIVRPGSFVGRCAELCGTYHSGMNFEVRALPANVFDEYLKLRSTVNTQTGAPYTAAEALSALQSRPGLNCGELCTPHAVTTSPFDTNRTARTASG
jgi:cytochrome c oxidase subunit 2